VLSIIFVTKDEEITGGWRKLHDKLVFTEYFCGDHIEEDETGCACRTHGRDEKCIHVD